MGCLQLNQGWDRNSLEYAERGVVEEGDEGRLVNKRSASRWRQLCIVFDTTVVS
jgi:hypothetical protein